MPFSTQADGCPSTSRHAVLAPFGPGGFSTVGNAPATLAKVLRAAADLLSTSRCASATIWSIIEAVIPGAAMAIEARGSAVT